jgi:hypothetical protein
MINGLHELSLTFNLHHLEFFNHIVIITYFSYTYHQSFKEQIIHLLSFL